MFICIWEKMKKQKTNMKNPKRNNKSVYFKDWTTQKLKDEARNYDELINGRGGCFSTGDLNNFDGIKEVLYSRGIEISNNMRFIRFN